MGSIEYEYQEYEGYVVEGYVVQPCWPTSMEESLKCYIFIM